ncbi:MAG: hypothetical protein AAB446_00180 [Patescibacteria group bacterium]
MKTKNKILIISFPIFISFFLFANTSKAVVLFEDSFDSQADWTSAQSTSVSVSDYNGGFFGNWTGFNNALTQCGAGITGRPGYNNFYVSSIAGYPIGAETCNGGSGKCWTKWQEACLAPAGNFDDADANLGYDLGQEYSDIYLRFYIKFPTSFSIIDGQAFKLYHVQHYNGGFTNPWNYFGRDTNNQPVVSGGIRRDADVGRIDFYTEARGYSNYYTHGFMFWPISTYEIAKAGGGIFDGAWHSIEIRVKANSVINTADGLIEVWVDGSKLSHWQDYPAEDINFTNSDNDLRGFRFLSVGGNNMSWTTACSDGSGNMAECEQWYAIDDVVFSTTYVEHSYVIGGGTPPPADTTPPSAPTGVEVQ